MLVRYILLQQAADQGLAHYFMYLVRYKDSYLIASTYTTPTDKLRVVKSNYNIRLVHKGVEPVP